jgi:hypothetical protein
MIAQLNTVLDSLFKSQVTLLKSGTPSKVLDSQVGFQPPDDEWSNNLSGTGCALNVYLLDLRENRKLRSNERNREIQNGVVVEELAPIRVDCHYLISAWSPATSAADKVAAEHPLLSETLAVLINNQPLVPRKVFGPNSPSPAKFPPELLDIELPMTILPSEGFPKLAEFWGTMGHKHPWKPVIYLIVTIPIELTRVVAGPMVTTRITEYRQCGKPETAEVWIQIGGTITDSAGNPVPHAWVRLETTKNEPLQTTETDKQGHFTFSNLHLGKYQLHVRAIGKDKTLPINVPSPSGKYDVNLT